MADKDVIREQIDELLAFVPNFADPEREYIVEWLPPWHAVYVEDVSTFFRLLRQKGWTSYDYNIQEDGARLADDDFVATADLDQIKRMVTFCLRGERFSSGHWDVMLKKGRITALLKRLQVLGDTLPEK